MEPWQEVAIVAESCSITPSPLAPISDDSYFTTLTQINDYYFSTDELLEDSNHSMTSLEEIISACVPVDMCTDDYWLDQCLDQCMLAPDTNAIVANMDCLLESPCNVTHANVTSSACGSSVHPPLMAESSANSMEDANTTSFVRPSPMLSDASSLPATQPWMHEVNPASEGYMSGGPLSLLNPSLLQIPTHGNEYTTNSVGPTEANEASSDNFDVSSSYELHVPTARRDQSPLDMGVQTLVHRQHLNTSNHKRKRGAQESEDSVSFLVMNETPTIDDGYVWRKYGQKDIKDRSYPRAYFRCAQHNCPIKKQTESSSDIEGSVLITYIGKHNHHI
ncbi:hypothetical protein L7F22_068418 [Adiantum nelumboides]|nr:hypothetical protein [Adiantum nelumboides]